MTVSHLTRTRDQLWSDLLVALGGDEAFLTRSLSARQIILEMLDTYDSSISLRTIDDVDALLAAVVNEAGGSASHLRQNKHEILAALVTALGGTAPSSSTSSTGQLLAAAVNAAGGGDDTPEWVPDNAKIYIDLVNDRAWTEADGEVEIDTLLGTDANTVNGWGTTEYDASNLTADGYTVANAALAFIGDTLPLVLNGATISGRFKQVSGGSSGFGIALLSADGNDALELDTLYLQGSSIFNSWGGSLNVDIQSIINWKSGGSGAINVFALTIDGSRAEMAVNGSPAASGVIGSADRPAGNPLVAALIYLDLVSALQSITIYDALPSTAGLSALSETGVTNTVPTGITIPWIDWGASGSNGTYSAALTMPNNLAQNLAGVDAEGNPCVISLISDETGQLSILFGGIYLTMDAMPAIGAYNFTIRATDPGGLYVEQEFTITVMA